MEPLEARRLLAVDGPAMSVTIRLAPASDPAGDGVVTSSRVVVRGQTSPGAVVRIRADGQPRVLGRTVADGSGHFRAGLDAAMGTTTLHARATGASGDSAAADVTMTRANQAVAWNSVALQAIRTGAVPAPDAARDLAIVQVSVYDAVNAIDRRYEPYAVAIRARRGTSADAAAASAAHAALVGLFPGQGAVLDAERASALGSIPDGPGKARGVMLGATVAGRILALRSNDGSAAEVDYVPGTATGRWRPTPPAFARAVDPQWGGVTPFALASGSQFRPPPPPAFNSPEYAAEYDQVKSLGAIDSRTRTADQTAIAHFWSDLAGTFDPPGHWNRIAEVAAVARRTSLADSARMFALLDMALADAGIAAWCVKYADNTWRPVTTIRAGDDGVNPMVVADPTWTPLWPTPPFPSYLSGHSTFSAAAAAVLDATYGAHFAFTDAGDPTMVAVHTLETA